MTNRKKGGLGRGLEALFADSAPIYEESTKYEDIKNDDKDRILYIKIDDIKPNKAQPRQTFHKEKLEELAKSIKSNGIIQPVVVRESDKTGIYELVAGERRWRAARIAGLTKIPAVVRDIDEKQNVILAILENMQREDLSPIEEARGINKMISAYRFTQQEAADVLGKSRVYITNSLRLLKLPDEIQSHLSNGKISSAHARALINVEGKNRQIELCEKIINQGLSVREAEVLANKNKKLVKNLNKKKRKLAKVNADIKAAQEELIAKIGTKVNINGTENQGKIEIDYYNTGELNRIIDALRKIEDK